MRGVRRTGSEVDEERLVGRDRLLLPDVVDRPVGEILGQVAEAWSMAREEGSAGAQSSRER